MSFKNLLVHLDPGQSTAGRVDVALTLAGGSGAHVTALCTAVEPALPTFVEAQLPAAIFQEARAELDKQLAKLARDFAAKASRAGVSAETRTLVARQSAIDAVSRNARYCDLAILGQEDDRDDGTVGPNATEDVALACGRPVLVVPYIGARSTLGRRIVVAWDAGREAARAVNDALPLLTAADEVSVVVVNPRSGNDGHGADPGTDIATHLARHGVKVDVKVYVQPDMTVANVLLSRITDIDADLLVMGCYGHSRWRETILGGVTHDILGSMTVPVLMSH